MPVTPILKRLGLLFDDLETRGFEPRGHLPSARIEVIAGDVALDDLAPDGREPSRAQVCERFVEVGLGHLLDRQVEMPARVHRSAEVGEDRRPILREHVLHRVDGHRGVEFVFKGEFLETDLMEADSDAPRPSLILAFFIALDPGLVAISRQAGSPILAITFLLFAFGFFRKNNLSVILHSL